MFVGIVAIVAVVTIVADIAAALVVLFGVAVIAAPRGLKTPNAGPGSHFLS